MMALPPVAALSSNSVPTSSTEGTIQVKEERPDEAEIRELAARMVEANKAKMAAAQAANTGAPPAIRVVQNHTILNFLPRLNQPPPSSPSPATTPDKGFEKKNDEALDITSQKGKFGWVTVGEEHLPFIMRSGEKYSAVRFVEVKLLAKYLNYLSSDIYSCTCIRSFYVTECEARLLTEINSKHCEGRFGRDAFTTKDLIVKVDDAAEFYNFLELCYNKLLNPLNSNHSRCGFVRINDDSVVPYTIKDDSRYVPLFYFEGETETLKKNSTLLGGWDLAYLKFCCKVQGIRSELFANDACAVISLADIQAYFPNGTKFDEFWPQKVGDPQLLVTNKPARLGTGAHASWIKVPHGPSPPSAETARISPAANPVPNGWSTGILPRYQSTAAYLRPPVTTQHSRVSSRDQMNATTTQAGLSRYVPRAQSNNVNQYYPAVSHSSANHNPLNMVPSNTIAQQPPPLVRVTSANTIPNSPYSPASVTYSCSSGGTNPLSSPMIMNNGLMPPPHMQYPASHNNNNSAQKFPPALIPVNGSTSRYYGSSPDVIDLSSPPHSPQRSVMMNGKQTPQPAHQAPSTQRQKQQQSNDNAGWSRLIPIPESPARQSNHFPFKMQKALVNGKMVPCINSKPYIYSELLMTVQDLLEYFFPGVSVSKCREVLEDVLQVTLFSGNLSQKQVLKENNKCRGLTEVLPLIQLKDVMQYMPQLKYIMERHMSNSGQSENAAKRARTS